MVYLPEAAEKYEIPFLEAPSANGLSATVLVHSRCAVVQGNVVVPLVNLHHETGTVGLGSGSSSVNILGAHPSSGVIFEVASWGRFLSSLFLFFLVDGGSCLVDGVHVLGGILPCSILWRAGCCLGLFFSNSRCRFACCDRLVVADVPIVAGPHRKTATHQP